MRSLVVALLLLGSATLALGQGAANPTYTREAPVTGSVIEDVDCATSSGTLLSSSALADARAVILKNEDGSNFVTICTAATCTESSGITLAATEFLTLPLGPDSDTLTCLGDSGTVTVGYIILK